jgi:hypothetical protein
MLKNKKTKVPQPNENNTTPFAAVTSAVNQMKSQSLNGNHKAMVVSAREEASTIVSL